MSTEKKIYAFISSGLFPSSFGEIFPETINDNIIYEDECFTFDFKENSPQNLSSDPYGFGIIKTLLGMHNSYGGCIIFGVNKNREIVGLVDDINIESINNFIRSVCTSELTIKSKTYFYKEKKIIILYAQKRKNHMPISINKNFSIISGTKTKKYETGTIFIRLHHETIEANSSNIPFLVSSRNLEEEGVGFPVHRSIPPSSSTIKAFVNRPEIEWNLWRWLLEEEFMPRFYLCGTGGSGKSTLAYEFAKTLSDFGSNIDFSCGSNPDYIIYLSAKETELDVLKATEKKFLGRDFKNKIDMYKEILKNGAAFSTEELSNCTTTQLESKLIEFFSNYSGLIVLDDIDALSRVGEDTGEETLYAIINRGSKKQKILYTMRNEPFYAKSSAMQVGGLKDNELITFLKAVCRQFSVPTPSEKDLREIKIVSSSLPLLIETIVGIRRYESSYADAIKTFTRDGGVEARKYLYDREFRSLTSTPRAKIILFGIDYFGDVLSLREISVIFVLIPREEIEECISKLRIIFLTISEGEGGEIKYAVSPSSSSYVKDIYFNNPNYDYIKRTVDTYKKSPSELSKDEKIKLMNARNFIKVKNYDAVISLASGLENYDNALYGQGEFQALLGQAYTFSPTPKFELALKCFDKAQKRNYSNIFMMRAKYIIFLGTERIFEQTPEVCNAVIENAQFSDRNKSEFCLKLGDFYIKKYKKQKHHDTKILEPDPKVFQA
ncbi:ATP-binding protein [Novacetimonas hansenii]|uniref:ATP-binding protein n=1 Tax=Novacetimonas hansenii TaxID=436 RepID=UPI0009C09179|nr:ATP-binding protein [Novacetimonas hansenii]